MNTRAATECPDPDQLQQLFSGQLSAPDSARLRTHLLECDRCALAASGCSRGPDVTAMLAEQTLPSGGDADPTLADPALADARSEPVRQPDGAGRLGGYRMLEVLGVGGMGVVYKAEDVLLRRLVALKVMKPEVAARPEARVRFLREAEAAAAIEHDNIVPIHQVGEERGIPFIAMQFLRGESLQTRLNRVGRLSDAETLRIAGEIAAGLHAAHARGLIHRDIKPDNIWLQEGSDRVRILDFGLARSNTDDSGLTQSGTVLGTPKYMAPEQARGHEVDSRCDLFSLGSVMYRMLAGKVPFDGSSLTATLIAVTHEDPPPLTALAPDVNPQLAELIERLLTKDPSGRPASAEEVSREIARLGEVVPQSALGKHSRRPPTVRTGAMLAAGFAAFLFLAILLVRWRTPDGTIVIELDSPVPVAQLEIDGQQVKFTPDASGKLLTVSVPEGTHQLTIRTPEGLSLNTELDSKPVTVRISETTKIRAWLENAEVRGNSSSTAAVQATARRTPKIWPAGPLPAWASDEPRWSIMKESRTIPGLVERPSEFSKIGRWNVDTVHARGAIRVARHSPDGKWLATGSHDGHVRVYDSTTMKLTQLLPGIGGAGGVCDLAWHPDSLRLAVAADASRALRIWTIAGQLVFEEFLHGGLNAVAWTFDGSRLICAGVSRVEVRAPDGSVLKSLGADQPAVDFGQVAAAPNSQRFVCWHHDRARIWNAETFKVEQTIDLPCPPQHGQDGHRIRWSSADHISLCLADRIVICGADGRVVREFPLQSLCAAAWRPDGETLTTWNWQLYDLNVKSGDRAPSQDPFIVEPTNGPVPTAIDWSPDGKHLVLAAGNLTVCNATLDEVEFRSDVTCLPVGCLSMHPDESRIATVSRIGDNCVRVWSADGIAERLLPLQEAILAGSRVAWSPTGRHLAAGWPLASHFRVGRADGDFVSVAGNCVSLAWNPAGTELAAGLTSGHLLITDPEGRILHDLDTGENSPVNVAWSPHGTLFAHVGLNILRVSPESPQSKLTLLTQSVPATCDFRSIWSPDGTEVCMEHDVFVSVADDVTERIRRAPHAAAWSADGAGYLSLLSHAAVLRKADGSEVLSRRTNGAVFFPNSGAWSARTGTVFCGHEQSLVVARNADDLQLKWSAVILPKQKSATFDVSGTVTDGDRQTLETELTWYAADEQGHVRLLSLAEFEFESGEEVLPVPGRYFDAQYGFSLSLGPEWKPAAPDDFTVPGVARAAWSRPGAVSITLFIQNTGATVDPSWLLHESVEAQTQKLAATVLEKEVRQIAGREAMWMVVAGAGTGDAITGSGPVKTIQHWIAIPREDHVLVALLTSPAGTFAASQKLFLESITTLVVAK